MQEVLKTLASALRAIGFHGSGQNYWKTEGDFVFVINFQGSQRGDNFYVNLGAQPVFIPAEGNADLKKLKEYECVLRRRVGSEWSWQMSDEKLASLEAEIISAQAAFFSHAQTMRASLVSDPPEVLLNKFSSGTTKARATLHLARAALALGHVEKARAFVGCGLELAGDKATILRSELKALLGSASREAAQ